MRNKLKEIKENLDNNPKFQESLTKMKPKKSIWGFLGVILFFFVPEIINVLYYKEINAWVYNYALNSPNQTMADSLIWLSKHSFDGEISYINIGLGIAFLIWLFKD